MSTDISKIRLLVSNWPEHISYDKSNEDVVDYYGKYNNGYTTKKHSFFYGKRNLDIFTYAMAIGKHYNTKRALKSKSISLPADSLKENEIWMMISVVFSEPNVDIKILSDGKEIVKICEQYANAGIEKLIDMDKNGADSFTENFQELLSIS